MKRFLMIFLATLLSFHLAYATNDKYDDAFTEAVRAFEIKKDYIKARSLFIFCQASDNLDQPSISKWIERCDQRLEELRRDAQAAERRRKAKQSQRIKNEFVYISVNAAESGDLFETTKSALSEVMRLNGRAFCPEIDDALTYVNAFIRVKPESTEGGLFKATGEGLVRLGSAIDEKDFVGQWSVASEATSAVSMDDAIRLLRNKLNYKLSYALDNLLNKRPQGPDYIIPNNTIAVYFASNNDFDEDSLYFFREAMYQCISMTPDMILSSALDEARNNERDKIAKLQAQNVKMEGRFPIHELEGFGQVLRLSVKKDVNDQLVFGAEISETIPGQMGNILTNVTLIGSDFNITDISAENQTIAAKMLAVRLGFHHWDVGETLGKYKIGIVDGVYCTLIQTYAYKPGTWDSPSKTTSPFKDIGLIRDTMIDKDGMNREEAIRWRFPTKDELDNIRKGRKRLGLDGKYWSCTSNNRGTHQVVDFITGKEESVKDKDSKVASWLLVKEF